VRVCRVEREHHCSDDVKHRKSNKGSHKTCPDPSDGSIIGFEKWAYNANLLGAVLHHEGGADVLEVTTAAGSGGRSWAIYNALSPKFSRHILRGTNDAFVQAG
jgi:hypothetical protein